jgi:hypothetical protein
MHILLRIVDKGYRMPRTTWILLFWVYSVLDIYSKRSNIIIKRRKKGIAILRTGLDLRVVSVKEAGVGCGDQLPAANVARKKEASAEAP